MATANYGEQENPYFVREINYDEIQRQDSAGEGSFGVVYRALWRDKYVAVKYIAREHKEQKDAFAVEVRQLSRVNHENIVKLYGACTKGPHIFLVMEYAEGGSLFNVLHCAPKIHYTMAHAMSWAYQCAKGVEYLHGMKPKPLIHRDLKSPNLLLIKGGTHLKICDFGTAADKNTYMTNNKGSAAWMAPEVFMSSNYTEKCDVFSWATILWEVMSRKRPFNYEGWTAYNILWTVYKGERPSPIKDCPPPIERLLTRCWDRDPSKRPDMNEIVETMSKICYLVPGADKHLIATSEEYYEEDEIDYNDDDDTISSSFDPFPQDKSSEHVMRELPQPSPEMCTPLTLEIDPNAWELKSRDPFADLQLHLTAGLDKLPPKNGAKSSVSAGMQSRQSIQTTSTVPESAEGEDATLDNMYLLLDEHLRPATPDMDKPDSVALFEEHKKLAQEYLKVQTEIALISQRKNDLLTARSIEDQRQRESISALQSEKESLLLIKELMVQQREQREAERPSSDWVIVQRPDQN